DLPLNGLGVGGQHEFYRGANRRLKKVPAAGGAIPQAECHMDVQERLVVGESKVTRQRQDLGLTLLVVPQVALLLRVKVADDRVAHSSDTGEVARFKTVFPRECQ